MPRGSGRGGGRKSKESEQIITELAKPLHILPGCFKPRTWVLNPQATVGTMRLAMWQPTAAAPTADLQAEAARMSLSRISTRRDGSRQGSRRSSGRPLIPGEAPPELISLDSLGLTSSGRTRRVGKRKNEDAEAAEGADADADASASAAAGAGGGGGDSDGEEPPRADAHDDTSSRGEDEGAASDGAGAEAEAEAPSPSSARAAISRGARAKDGGPSPKRSRTGEPPES